MEDTMLLMWGRNDDGQLGNRTDSSICGSPVRRLSRERSGETRNGSPCGHFVSPTKISTASSRSRSASVSGWNQHRASLSTGGDGSSGIPIPCPALVGTRVLHVACGSRHTLAVVAGGEAYSWGWGACGQLGHGDDHCSAVPRVIEALRASDSQGTGGIVTGVSAGGIHSAAVLEGGGVYTWGGSSYGQLGLGPQVTAKGAETVPQQVMLPPPSQNGESTAGLPRRNSLTRVLKGNHADGRSTTPLLAKTVACGGMHTAALTEEGVVYCWGRADSGQLGIGADWVHESSSGVMGVEWPKRVCGHLEERQTVSIACGGFHTAAVTAEGECYTWGKDDFGMLGVESGALLQGGLFCPHPVTLRHPGESQSTAEDMTSPTEKIVAVACGGWHTAVIGERGGLWTCGRGEYGRLGLGDQTSQSLLTPVPLEQPQQEVYKQQQEHQRRQSQTSIMEGVITAPSDDVSDISTVDLISESSKKPPPPPFDTGAVRTADPVIMAALGGTHSLVLTASGKVFGFGRQEHGRLGTGAEEVAEDDMGVTMPVEVSMLQQPGDWRVRSMSCGGVHSAAILVRQSEEDNS